MRKPRQDCVSSKCKRQLAFDAPSGVVVCKKVFVNSGRQFWRADYELTLLSLRRLHLLHPSELAGNEAKLLPLAQSSLRSPLDWGQAACVPRAELLEVRPCNRPRVKCAVLEGECHQYKKTVTSMLPQCCLYPRSTLREREKIMKTGLR